jgi:Lon protease-like protein
VASNTSYTSIAELPIDMRLFPLSGAILLPRSYLPLNIFEPRYLAMVDEALKTDRFIGMIQPKLTIEPSEPPALEAIGCAGRIIQFAETGDGCYRITLYGVARFTCLESLSLPKPFRHHKVDFSRFTDDLHCSSSSPHIERARVKHILDLFAEIIDIQIDKKDIDNVPTSMLINSLATIGHFTPVEKQALLEAKDISARADLLYSLAELILVKKQTGKDSLQ